MIIGHRVLYIWEAQNIINLNIAIILAYDYIRSAYKVMLNNCIQMSL